MLYNTLSRNYNCIDNYSLMMSISIISTKKSLKTLINCNFFYIVLYKISWKNNLDFYMEKIAI